MFSQLLHNNALWLWALLCTTTQIISLQLWDPILTPPTMRYNPWKSSLQWKQKIYMDLNVWNWTPRKFLWCMVELWRGVNSKLFCTQQAAGSSENTNTQNTNTKIQNAQCTNTQTQIHRKQLSHLRQINISCLRQINICCSRQICLCDSCGINSCLCRIKSKEFVASIYVCLSGLWFVFAHISIHIYHRSI